MDWKDVGKIVKSAAPILGGVLGGPAGAAASAAGNLVASFLGVDSEPDKVKQALEADPQLAGKLKELELKHQDRLLDWQEKQLDAETERIKAVNAQMGREAKSEKWPQYAWRPFWGFVSALAFLGLVVAVGLLAYRAVTDGDAAAINMIPQLVTSMSTLFAIPGGILGVSAWHRGREKRERAATGSGKEPSQGLLKKLLGGA